MAAHLDELADFPYHVVKHRERAGQASASPTAAGRNANGGSSLCRLDVATKIAKGKPIMTGRELFGAVATKEPISFNGKLGWISVLCDKCNTEYDVREIANETTHPYAIHVARFDCPRGHHCEARRMWKASPTPLIGTAPIILNSL
jgi:hypothetical protein